MSASTPERPADVTIPPLEYNLTRESTGSASGKPGPETETENGQLQHTHQARERGAGFRAAEEAVSLPHNNMFVVMTAFFITMFLASLDNTIVTTALPTIAAELHGTASDYSWTGVSYMLCQGAFLPLWGKLSDVVGRKTILYPSIGVFLLGSGLCGAAKSMAWLIACRAVQGVGAGGIVIMVQITLSDIVSLRDRGKYSSVFGGCWGVANVIGPLVGGVLTENVSWRWCFWINLPTGGVAAIMLLFLNLNPVKKMSLREFLQKFDFLGVFLLMSGTAMFLAGFSIAADSGWNDPSTIGLVVAGLVLLALAAVVEWRTTRMAVIPPRLLKTRTTLSLFGITFFHGIGFMCTNFYLPVLFQGVNGNSAFTSGLKMFPVALGGTFSTILAGPIVTATKRTRPFIWLGTVFMTVGAALLIALSEKSNLGEELGFTLIQGIGTGFLFQPPLILLQAAMPLKDMAAATGAFYLVRTLGTTTGVSLGGVAFQSQLATRLRAIPALAGTTTEASILQGDYKDIKNILPLALREEVIVALSRSLRTIFLMLTPLSALTFLLSLLIRHYTLERKFVAGGAQQKGDLEEAPTPPELVDEKESGEDVTVEGEK